MFKNLLDLVSLSRGSFKLGEKGVRVTDKEKFRKELLDELVYNSVFNPDKELADSCRYILWETAKELGAIPSSIREFYKAMGREEIGGFTVPAVNIRGLTYDVARALVRAAIKNNVGAFIFEIARSEIGYTMQRPAEYATVVLAACMKEGYKGSVFIQSDHFQFNAKNFLANPEKEKEALKNLIKEAIEAEFYNIDIDTSTLVDLSKTTIAEQQGINFELTAELTEFIRRIEPEGITVSVGGEIGEVGGKNSTVEELRAYLDGYIEELRKNGSQVEGISKVSVQTGTTHGGVPLPDGTIAKVKIDFHALKDLSYVCRKYYGLAGAVQHGASTLPEEAFDKFPEVGTAEIHLATGFQNIMYEHPLLPKEFKEEIYSFIKSEFKNERKATDTEEQFIYKTRKKAVGPFKKEWWNLSFEVRDGISRELEEKFELLFTKLNVVNTREIVDQIVKPRIVQRRKPAGILKGLHL